MSKDSSRAPIRLLIVTGFSTLEGFLLPMENRTLVWGLDQANIRWSLYNPWDPRPNLLQFDAVLISVYRSYANNFIYHAEKFEAYANDAGIPVINKVAGSEGLHSLYLERWHSEGVPCARFQRFQTADDLTLDCYPLILRRDGVHRGAGMHLVYNRHQAEELIAAQHADSARTYPSLRGALPIDLAIEFVETQAIDGYYCKWRSYVVGSEVIPAHFMRSLSPFVNYKDAALWSDTCSMDQVFQSEGELHPDRVRKAARALDYDIIAIDYGLRPDGSYIFFEGNRVRATAGDSHVKWLTIREPDLRFGKAVAALVRQRVDELPRKSPRLAPAARPAPARPAASAFLVKRRKAPARQPGAEADPRILAEIIALLQPLRQMVREMNWKALVPWLLDADLSLKGQVVTASEVENLLRVRAKDIESPEVCVDDVIDLKTTGSSAEVAVRIAVVGERIDGAGPDGLILDVVIRFVRDGGTWRLDRLAVDCPPDWAQWNSRPNDLAPIHYGAKAKTASASAGSF